jgi:hypothetical protein
MGDKKTHNYFIREHLFKEKIFHGGIGLRDIETILLKNGYQPVIFPHHYEFSFKAKLRRAFFLVQCLFRLPQKATIIFQAPLYATIHGLLIRLLLRFRKQVTVICFITDINGIKDGDDALLQKEIRFYKKMKFFIVHNTAMKEWLLKHNPQAQAGLIEFFDFLAPVNTKMSGKSFDIAFAGNLEKSGFLKELKDNPELVFHVYGENGEALFSNEPNIRYHGANEPFALPGKLQGSFGLVWDGESAHGLKGVFGNYARYISPHKLSLYIISGLPVICHKESAAAQLVNKYQVGLTVNSLDEVKEKIGGLSDGAYQKMQKNCLDLAERISQGKCLESALKELGRGTIHSHD